MVSTAYLVGLQLGAIALVAGIIWLRILDRRAKREEENKRLDEEARMVAKD